MAYDASDSLQAVSTGVGGIAAFGSAWEQASALKAQGEFQLSMSRINQQFADIQADQVIRQGDYQANQIRKKGEKVVGSQRAAAAAQGIDVNDSQGSAAELIDDTKLATANDISMAHTNAWMAAWGIKTQAKLNVDSAEASKSGSEFAAGQTLLTGGLQAVGAAAKVGSIYVKTGKKETTPVGSSHGDTQYGSAYDAKTYDGWWKKPSKDGP